MNTELAGKQLPNKLAGVNTQDVLARYLSNESTETIARDYGATRQALAQYLVKHAEEDWKTAQMARAVGRKERAEDRLSELQALVSDDDKVIDAARVSLSLACAREELKAAQWDLERVCKRIYGQDQPLNDVLAGLVINIGLRRGRVIEAEPVVADMPNGAVQTSVTDETA